MTTTPEPISGSQSQHTIACATHFAEGALSGEVVGAAIALLYRRRKYTVAICGEAHRDPTWARGVVAALEDELRELVHERSAKDTTI